MRNLKTKDYLGKARLVAASDRSNAFTGFAGSEIKNAGRAAEKDDRPTENVSFAATNLVKPGLQSRRQQSEPPNGRNAFPPTPPPENDKPPQMSRGASVRNGPKPMPAKLNIEPPRSNSYTKTSSPQNGPGERRGPSRAASEARSPPQPQRGYSQRDQGRSRQPEPPRDDESYDDVYDLYNGGGGDSRSSRQPPRRNQQRYIEEELEGSEYDSFDEGEFEMVSNRRQGPGSVSSSSRGQSRRPDVRKFRVKVHAEDVRYIMIGAAVEFPDLVDRIRDKFGLRGRFKIKVRDEDSPTDMITMGDQDDLDMIMVSAKQAARKQRQEIGKMEVSCLSNLRPEVSNLLICCRFGSKKFRCFLYYSATIYIQRYPATTIRSNDTAKHLASVYMELYSLPSPYLSLSAPSCCFAILQNLDKWSLKDIFVCPAGYTIFCFILELR